MNMPTQDEINSLLRHGYTAAGTAFTIAAMIAVIPPDVVQPAIAALHDVGDGLEKAFGGVSKLVVIFGPIIAGLSARAAAFAVSLKSQVTKVHQADPHELLNVVKEVTPTLLAKTTAAIPGVQVTVTKAAPDSLRVLAADPTQPDIVKAKEIPPSMGQKP